jgi:hypothetical protein
VGVRVLLVLVLVLVLVRVVMVWVWVLLRVVMVMLVLVVAGRVLMGRSGSMLRIWTRRRARFIRSRVRYPPFFFFP